MTRLTRSTVKNLCVRAGISRAEVLEEAQKLLDIYEDPAVPADEKERVKAKLDKKIEELENRVTTRRLKESRKIAGAEPSAP